MGAPYQEAPWPTMRNWQDAFVLRGRAGLVEKKMFGGLAFMVRGNMCCGVLGEDVVIRTGKPMRGFVVVDADGTLTDEALEDWITLGLRFARSLPPK